MRSTFVFVLVFCASYVAAQENTGQVKNDGISLSMGHTQLKDENVHPKVFGGLTFGVSYLHYATGRNISEYTAGIKLSAMNTSYEDFPSAAGIKIMAGYKHLYNIVRRSGFSYHLGPLVDVQYGTYALFNWDESHLHFANYISTGAGSRINYSMDNISLCLHLDFPLVSCIFRPRYNPQYKIDDMTAGGIISKLVSNPEAALPGKNFWLNSGVEMKYNSHRGKSRSLGYNFFYHHMQAKAGNSYKNVENSISFKLNF